MKTVIVTNTKKMDDTPAPTYSNEDVSSYKFPKQHENIFMDIIRNKISLPDVQVCPFDIFQHISSCHTVGGDQHLPSHCLSVFDKINDTETSFYNPSVSMTNHLLIC